MTLVENVPGATPLDDLSGLLPTHISSALQEADKGDYKPLEKFTADLIV